MASLDTPLAGALVGGAVQLGTGLASVMLLAVFISLGSWLSYEQYVLSLRSSRRSRSEGRKSKSVDAASPAYVRPRELWRLSDLEQYDGSHCEDGPILLAANGLVFNVALGRSFYGPGGEYAVMGGTDASRYLAKNSVEPESPSEAAAPLTLAERAALGAWTFSLQQKYDVVGRMASPEEASRMDDVELRRESYLDRMEEMSAVMEAQGVLEAAWHTQGVDQQVEERGPPP